MIIDKLANAGLYKGVHERIGAAFDYLQRTDLASIAAGKYAIDGDNVFAIVQEYETMDSAAEQMESHKKYFDVQYMINGEELVGHAFSKGLTVSKEYDAAGEFMLYKDAPEFFTKLSAGTFMVFFPEDAHMPCISTGVKGMVKKVVVKVLIS